MNTRSTFVPSNAGEITAEWLKAVLAKRFPNDRFANFTVERIGEGYGLASEIYRVAKKDDNGSFRTAVVKLWSLDGSAGVGEVNFYRHIGQQAGVRVPHCYFAKVDRVTRRAVLILEDFDDAVQGDCLRPLDAAMGAAVARELALMHVTWRGASKLSSLAWLIDRTHWPREKEWLESRRALFLDRYGDRLDRLTRQILDQAETALLAANQRLSGADKTLLHGDFHLDNLVFAGGREPVLLDWSRCLVGPAAYNLADLLFVMCQEACFDEVLAAYVDSFTGRGQSLDQAALIEQLGGALVWVFIRGTCGVARWEPSSEREKQLVNFGIQRLVEAVHFWTNRHPEFISVLQFPPPGPEADSLLDK
ncbi:MAG: aminoglycoside phosphotransferase family protein [Ardenticatenaceae bacterium]|nr:aminoglycoside phosphotransferase family protein [Ardenticatenaceae bacterium]